MMKLRRGQLRMMGIGRSHGGSAMQHAWLNLVLLLLAGCSTAVPATTTLATPTTLPPTLAVSAPTPPPAATLDAWRFLPACGQATTAIDLATLAAASQPSWKQYTQPDYGLSVTVPPDWRLAVGPHSLCLAPTAAPTLILTIGFRGSIESAAIDRIAIAAGQLITRGSVIILGQPVTRNVLVYQNQDKAILYNGFGEMSTPRLALTASLDDFRPDYDSVALTAALQTTADQVVASLASGPPITTWQTYTSPAFRVSVQYPSNWLPDQSGDAIYSGPDGFFQITSVESLGPSAKAVCELSLQNLQTNPNKSEVLEFGQQPTLEILQVDQQPACLLIPSSDQAATYRRQAFLAVEYPDSQTSLRILQFWADKDHIRALAARLAFVRTP
jgi:hypothetical protein